MHSEYPPLLPNTLHTLRLDEPSTHPCYRILAELPAVHLVPLRVVHSPTPTLLIISIVPLEPVVVLVEKHPWPVFVPLGKGAIVDSHLRPQCSSP